MLQSIGIGYRYNVATYAVDLSLVLFLYIVLCCAHYLWLTTPSAPKDTEVRIKIVCQYSQDLCQTFLSAIMKTVGDANSTTAVMISSIALTSEIIHIQFI